MKYKEIISRVTTSLILLSILYYSYIDIFFFKILIFITFVLSSIEFYKLLNRNKKIKSYKFTFIFLGLIYFLSSSIFISIFLDLYKEIIFYFILICIFTDIGGLCFGKIFKGKKLTKISPNKTYSGVYGSFIFSFICMYIFSDLTNLNLFSILILTISLCLLSQLGDLGFSYLKRQARVKDTGKFLPGHGGILDRVDGIIISVPINLLIYILST